MVLCPAENEKEKSEVRRPFLSLLKCLQLWVLARQSRIVVNLSTFMNRRNFITISALAGMTPGQLARAMRGSESNPSKQDFRNKMWLLKKLLSTPQSGFPTLTPTFAAQFAKGTG